MSGNLHRVAVLGLQAQADRIRNALLVWAENLGGESFEFP
jgi:hypothetical protein